MEQKNQLAEWKQEGSSIMPEIIPTMMEIIQSKPSNLKALAFLDYEKCAESIENVIADTQILISTTKEINDLQLKAAAKLIISDYGDLSLPDLKRCMSDGIKGLYGEIYRFDVNVVCSWLTKYQNEKEKVVSGLPVLTDEQVSNLRKWQEKKIKEPVEAKELVKSAAMPENVRQGLTNLFKKHGIKQPFKASEKRQDLYKWPEPKDDFEKQCLDVFKEKWIEQGEKLLKKGSRPYIMHPINENDVMLNPDNWLTYCYQLKMNQQK